MSIDPVCILHGKKHSEHEFGFCLYCCLCYKTLTPDTCHVKTDGTKEDVCESCAAAENRPERIKYTREQLTRYENDAAQCFLCGGYGSDSDAITHDPHCAFIDPNVKHIYAGGQIMIAVVETLMCAAIRLRSGEIIVGASHARALEEQRRSGRFISNDEFDVPGGHGFITNTGRFVSVYEAWGIVVAAGQLKLGGSDGMPQEAICRQYLISEGVIFNSGR